jgi:RimJ/RimL family protein N-acetyltransferase
VTRARRFVIRAATAGDSADILAWRNDPRTREMSGSQDVIAATAHAQWYLAKLASPDCCIYIAAADAGAKLGMVRFDRLDRRTARASINMSPEHRGQGLGAKILQRAVDTYLAANVDVTVLQATIKNENAASERIFTQVGFSGRAEIGIPGFFAMSYARA